MCVSAFPPKTKAHRDGCQLDGGLMGGMGGGMERRMRAVGGGMDSPELTAPALLLFFFFLLLQSYKLMAF